MKKYDENVITAAIGALRMSGEIEISGNPRRISEFLNGLDYAVYVMKGVQEQLEKSDQNDTGWIPVEERLPEESLNSVLGWDEYRKRCCFVQYLGGRWILGIDSVKITAWMPVPEPYNQKSQPAAGDTHQPTLMPGA